MPKRDPEVQRIGPSADRETDRETDRGHRSVNLGEKRERQQQNPASLARIPRGLTNRMNKIDATFSTGDAATDELLTAEDVAALLKVKVSWVYDRIRPTSGDRLPHIRLGRYVRFERSAVEDFIRRQRNGYVGPRSTPGK